MVLNGEGRQLAVTHTFDGVVVEIGVSHFKFSRQILSVNRKAVVLGSDLDFAGQVIHDGLISAAVSELELERFGAASE